MQKADDNEHITMEEMKKIEDELRQRRLDWSKIHDNLTPPSPSEVYFRRINAAYRKLLGASKARKLILDNLLKADLEVGQAVAEMEDALGTYPQDHLKTREEIIKIWNGENNESQSSE